MGSSLANQPKNTGPRPEPNRPVKPRKPHTLDKPVIAIDGEIVLLENGETFTFDDLPNLIRTQPSSILVAHHFGKIIRYLDSVYDGNPLWQYRATPLERAAWAPNRKRKAVMLDCIIGYLGFNGENKKAGHFHYPLSPETFCLKTANELRRGIPESDATIVKLMEWAKEVRSFLQKHKLRLSPTSGGIAAQLLKDEKFYPSARRKVPRLTNAKARDQLPGNFYRLYSARTGVQSYTAAYLDQTSAHHTAAKSLEFPNANSLRRYGHYSNLRDKAFAKAGTPKFDQFIGYPGLFYLAFETPRFHDNDFPLPNCEFKEPGYHRGFFYSNEISYLKELKVRIRHIIACWVSPDIDPGLNRYSEWALSEIEQSKLDAKPWLKPTLLSTYGVLAAKPKHLEFGYKRAENAEPKRYPCGSGFIDVRAKRTKKEREPLMSNVIHRGMIEAQTRLVSLKFARELAQQDYTILAIYADSIFVEDTKPLPLLSPPWRVQNFLTELRFESATHFRSRQLSKTPGIPGTNLNTSKLPPRPRAKKKSPT